MSMAPSHDELLEQDAVLAHLAGRDLHRANRLADLAMALHIVGAGRLLDEIGFERRAFTQSMA
jgi:hypothetical protein